MKSYFTNLDWLVVSTPLKNMKVNGKDYPIYNGKEKCLKTISGT